MRLTALFILSLGILASAPVAAEPASGTASLDWLSGKWASADRGEWTEENWSSSKGGVLLGNSKRGRGDKAIEFEQLRISPDSRGVVTYWASPGGSAPTPFALVASTTNHAIFENPQHDYPTRIEYRRDGEKLTATISGPGGADPMSWHHRRVGD